MAKGGANHHHNNSSHMHDQGRSGEHRPRSSPSDELSHTATPIISQLTPSGLSVQERRGCFRSAADAAAASGGCASVGRARLTAALFAVAGLAAISCYVTGVVVGGGGSGGGSGGGAFLVQSQPRALSDAVRGLDRGGRKGTSKRTGIKWGAGSEVTLRGRIDPGQEERRAQYQPGARTLEEALANLTKRYDSFEDFALDELAAESDGEALPVPFVDSPEGIISLPVAIIIGTQKGGTQNLRSHLLTHPLLAGKPGREVHFFDWNWFPKRMDNHDWPGDGHENDEPLSAVAVGNILSVYAERNTQSLKPADRDTMPTVDSSPLYAFHPLVPYRIKMVLPHARLILILRDPTERYFSHLRMAMCSSKMGRSFEEQERISGSYFHNPGAVEEYLQKAEASYEPYTPLCRGEGATASDLRGCYRRTQAYNALYRGLFAEQLERWFRVFDRSQILIVESGDMFSDFVGTLKLAARHVGLPPHEFEYDPVHQHATLACEKKRPELFAEGGRYDKMREDEQQIRDWYRPHNQRLYELLGRELQWE